MRDIVVVSHELAYDINAPAAQGAQPLLRVSTYGQSQAAAPAPGTGQTISIQFNMAE